MTWPASDVVTTNQDAPTDSPAAFRSDVLDLTGKFNQLRNHVTSLAQTLVSRATAALMRADLGLDVGNAVQFSETRLQNVGLPAEGRLRFGNTNNRYIDLDSAGNYNINGFNYGSGAANVALTGGAFTESGVKIASVGVLQTWQDVTGSRALGTAYTNSTGRPISVAIVAYNASASSLTWVVGGLNRAAGGVAGTTTYQRIESIVPDGGTYLLSGGTYTISSWHELR